ncbi:hypothetical protein JHK82_054244 [Glycine max]|uniref:Uncharacterized protein n=2 Tax=Glycine subgen. Soja TaxID=1462606 RepID=K7MZG1_SOYBN|nr:hypothetical protein JHK86_054091 [Glycine max]KAG4916592.1 hypothetical protein JHK87_054149 [Glycine soja]KAG4928560.1 hypothetical protein JHK85_055046 [Glycine max]KAG5084076.1 hypothetical protein JHK84_054114 [Glycine max]KAG5086847.1 hypothetical protein JHK82_054244 [Glycine max]
MAYATLYLHASTACAVVGCSEIVLVVDAAQAQACHLLSNNRHIFTVTVLLIWIRRVEDLRAAHDCQAIYVHCSFRGLGYLYSIPVFMLWLSRKSLFSYVM